MNSARYVRGKVHRPLLLLMLFLGLSLNATNGSAEQQAPKGSNPATSQNTEGAQAKPVLEPKAIELLQAASRRLTAARSLSFTVVATHETPSRPGPPLLNSIKGEVILQRPNKLRVITPGDGRAFEFYYDGKTMMAYAPMENLVAVADAPPTIDEMLTEANRLAAISFPFSDVIATDPYKEIAPRLKLAFYVGQSHVVGATTTDIVAVESDIAFGQIWLGAEDHLPRMIRVMYLDDPLALRFQAEYSNWEIDPVVPADTFTSSKASSAPHIPFSRPDLQPLAAQKPTEQQSKPGKTK